MPIGPALPPHLAHLAGGSSSRSPSPEPGPSGAAARGVAPAHDDDDSDDDAFGPALPPHLAAARGKPSSGAGAAPASAGPSRPAAYESPSPPRLPSARQPGPAAGPAMGPSFEDDDESDDDVIGPALPTGNVVEKTAVQEFMEREERMRQSRETDLQPKKPQRDEWMLLPPTSGLASMTDPLRKRPTTFSRTNKDPGELDSTVWTETPAEKAQRLADEKAGIKRKAPGSSSAMDDGQDARAKRMRDEEIRRGVEKHNKDTRGKTLLEQHAARDKKDEEPKAIWDHARDMGVTGRLLSERERSDKIADAKNLNDRFGHSKRGAYDI